MMMMLVMIMIYVVMIMIMITGVGLVIDSDGCNNSDDYDKIIVIMNATDCKTRKIDIKM